MFKKTLLAVAVASLATSATAGTLSLVSSTGSGADNSEILVAAEAAPHGAVGAATTVDFDFDQAVNFVNADAAGAAIDYVPGADVPDGSRIVFTLTNGYFADATYLLVTSADGSATVATLVNTTEDADGNVTAIELSVSTALTAATNYSLVNAVGAAAAVSSTGASSDDNTISINFADGLGDGDTIDIAVTNVRDAIGDINVAEASAIELIEFSTQFSAAVTAAANATVDVENSRLQFVNAAPATDVNTLGYTITLDDDGVNLDVLLDDTTVSGTLTLTDSASFAGITGDSTDTTGFTNTAVSDFTTEGGAAVNLDPAAGVATVAIAAGEFDTSGGNDDAGTLTLEVSNDAVLAARTITGSLELDYTGIDTDLGTATKDLGTVSTWVLNGAQVKTPYFPVGFSGLQTRITMANSGTQNAEIEIEAYDTDGNTYGPVQLTDTLAGGTNMTISDVDVKSWLSVSGSAQLTATITINAPADDITATGYTQKAGTGRQLVSVTVE